MSDTNENKRKLAKPTEEAGESRTKKNREFAMSVGGSNTSIADAAAQLHSLLQAKENELKEREADFTRRVNLFETENPMMGGDNDVIQLNVGGTTNIAVLRRTLTLFEDSMLAAKFSGRWDDSLERDRDGNIFIDQNPEQFMRLIDYLRLRMNNRSQFIPDKHLPTPSYAFCSMLEYYNLMPGIYPPKWFRNSDKFCCEEESYGTWVFTTRSNSNGGAADNVIASVVHDFGRFKDAGVSEFNVTFDKGSTGSVGWFDGADDYIEHTIPDLLTNVVENSIFLNLAERKIFGPASILEENILINHAESINKVTCRFDAEKKRYSVELLGVSPAGGVSSKLHNVCYPNSVDVCRVFPMISFTGKVTVTSLKYAIDRL